uniref:Uncharacterized protein n=1 Tax=Anguilla anguilla TaxID=7936 RepID=A0A0E9PK88_ANGAN
MEFNVSALVHAVDANHVSDCETQVSGLCTGAKAGLFHRTRLAQISIQIL